VGEPSCSPGGPKVGRRALVCGGCLPVHIHSAGPAPLLGGVPSSGAHVWLCVPSTHSAAAGGRSSGGGRIHPLVPAVLPAETAASGVGRRSVRRSDPQARASTRSIRGGAPSTSLAGAVLDTWGWGTQAQGRRPRRVATLPSAAGLGSRANDLATSSRHR